MMVTISKASDASVLSARNDGVGQVPFRPVVLGDELAERSFALGMKNLSCDPGHVLAATCSKTCHVRFGVMSLVIRQRVELVQRVGTRQDVRNRQHQPSMPSPLRPNLDVQSRVVVFDVRSPDSALCQAQS